MSAKFKMPSMPIDVMAVLQEATNVEAAREVPLCVSVLLDEAAPADLVAFVRSSFASASPQARVSVNYFEDGSAVFDPKSDMAVIAAGVTPEVGQVAAAVRSAGVPALVVTTLPEMVRKAAEFAGYPIPKEDLVAPEVSDGDVVALGEPVVVKGEPAPAKGQEGGAFAFLKKRAQGEGPDATAAAAPAFGESAAGAPQPASQPATAALHAGDPLSLEPYALNGAFADQLRRRMGEWVVAAFREKRLAFAQAFDFVRRPLSVESVRATSVQNGAVGVVLFIPGADMPVMTLNQAKMILQIAAAYGQPLTAERVKELAAVVGGGFACRAVARQVAGVVPALGWAVKGAVGYAGTMAMGHAAIEYFEAGGNVSGLAAVINQARETANDAVDSTVAGRAAKQTVREMGARAKGAALARAKQAVKNAPAGVANAAVNVAATAAGAVRDVRAADAARAQNRRNGVQ